MTVPNRENWHRLLKDSSWDALMKLVNARMTHLYDDDKLIGTIVAGIADSDDHYVPVGVAVVNAVDNGNKARGREIAFGRFMKVYDDKNMPSQFFPNCTSLNDFTGVIIPKSAMFKLMYIKNLIKCIKHNLKIEPKADRPNFCDCNVVYGGNDGGEVRTDPKG